MNAKEYLESKGIFGLDTKKRHNEVIEWMEDYALMQVKNCSMRDDIKLVCDVCGSHDVIEAPHMGKNCNRCHPLSVNSYKY